MSTGERPIDGILGTLRRRFVIVAGKGGVGKSTTAAAIALAIADRGSAVRLLSIDPAHSAADVLGEGVGERGVRTSRCSSRLQVEELDAAAAARALGERARAPLAELIERGTYLDAEDLGEFLSPDLPGREEIVAALHLGTLAGSARPGTARVVVDTPPTGHLQRLLDAPELVHSWLAAFGAMERKATAVAEALARRPARWEAAEVLDEVETRIAAFERALVDETELVVVTAEDPMVRLGTGRLEEDLARRGLRVACVIRVERPSGPPVPSRGDSPGADAGEDVRHPPRFTVSWLGRSSTGCAALRRWGSDDPADGLRAAARVRRSRAPSGDPPTRRVPGALRGEVLREVLARDLLLVVGKGGVGKTTCAAALAVGAAAGFGGARRPSVRLLGIDPAGSIEDVLPAGDEGKPRALEVEQVDAPGAYAELRRGIEDVLGGGSTPGAAERLRGAASLDADVLRALWKAPPPGLDEVMGLVELMEVIATAAEPGRPSGEGGAGLVVVDSAPTGHLLRFLSAPEVAADWARTLMRGLLKYREVFPMQPLAGKILAFAGRLRHFRELLGSDRAGVVVVTLEHPVVRAETERLLAGVASAGLAVRAIVMNRVTPGEEPEAGAWATTEDVPRIVAPLRRPPPRGGGQLIDFLAAWRTTDDPDRRHDAGGDDG